MEDKNLNQQTNQQDQQNQTGKAAATNNDPVKTSATGPLLQQDQEIKNNDRDVDPSDPMHSSLQHR